MANAIKRIGKPALTIAAILFVILSNRASLWITGRPSGLKTTRFFFHMKKKKAVPFRQRE